MHAIGESSVFPATEVQALIDALAGRGYRVIGPVLHQGAIGLGEITDAAALPRGLRQDKTGGREAIRDTGDGAYFAHTVGPEAPKRYLHPAERRICRIERHGADLSIVAEPDAPVRYAFLGVRGCDLAGMAVLDRVLRDDRFRDPAYAARRADNLIIAVNCTEPGGTCFCASMGTGPRAGPGYDLALTELLGGGRHDFLAEVGTEAGAALLQELACREPADADRAAADTALAEATANMGRRMPAADLKTLLQDNREHPRWDAVAERCLTCANCTMVCPTCFCTTVTDTSDLEGEIAARWQHWDSCFTLDFSIVHGGSLRASARSRYRQWMTHKLADWHDQFGTSGCVGCGRCIAWCPVGIDITEEAAAIHAAPQAGGGA
jgi:ferredoxin